MTLFARLEALLWTRSNLASTCITDFDRDGGITGDDVAAFFTAHENAFETSDLSEYGGITGGDIAAFFAEFEAGAACTDVDLDGGITGSDVGAFFTALKDGGC